MTWKEVTQVLLPINLQVWVLAEEWFILHSLVSVVIQTIPIHQHFDCLLAVMQIYKTMAALVASIVHSPSSKIFTYIPT
jgi:hypothetical protein